MPLKEDLLATLGDPSYHDVVLVGTDGVEVPATKYLLAARSPHFKRSFLGHFRESTEHHGSRVELPFPSAVLKALVYSCYSDEIDLSILLGQEITGSPSILTDDHAVLLVKLRAAAVYLEFPEVLANATNVLATRVLSNQPNSAGCVCAILGELFAQGESESPLFQVMMAVVEAKPRECLLLASQNNSSGIQSCPLEVVSKILERAIDPFVACKCLEHLYCNVMSDATGYNDSDNVVALLRELAGKIDLTCMATEDLATIQAGALFSSDDLLAAHVAKVGSREKTQEVASPLPFVLVVGAGEECVNGIYQSSYFGGPTSNKCMSGRYADMTATFSLERLEDGCLGITVSYGGGGGFTFGGGTSSIGDRTKKRLYTTSIPIAVDNVPFGDWAVCGGNAAAPAPFVAFIQPENPETSLVLKEVVEGKSTREILTAFYRKCKPEKVALVDSLLTKYAGKEEKLLRNLAFKYNLHPSTFGIASQGGTGGAFSFGGDNFLLRSNAAAESPAASVGFSFGGGDFMLRANAAAENRRWESRAGSGGFAFGAYASAPAPAFAFGNNQSQP